MNCPKCNNLLNVNQTVCSNCGMVINGQQPYQQQNQMMGMQQPYQQQNQMMRGQQSYQNQTTSAAYQKIQAAREESSNEWDLIQTYVGANSDKMTSGFSWCTAFFGIYYMVYRKMYSLAAICYIINIITITLLPKFENIISLVIGIVVAMIFKEMYMKKVTKKVEKIQEKNQGKTHEELLKICEKKGGTSIIAVIIYFGIAFAVSFVVVLIQSLLEAGALTVLLASMLGKELKTEKNVVMNKLSFTVVEGVIEQTTDENLYEVIHIDDESNICKLTVKQQNNNGCHIRKDCFQELDILEWTSANVSEDEINGITWNTRSSLHNSSLSEGNKFNMLYEYYTEKDDIIYTISIDDYGMSSKCDELSDKLKESMILKQ